MSGSQNQDLAASTAQAAAAAHSALIVDQVHEYEPGLKGVFARIEDIFGTVVLSAMALIPVVEALLRSIFREHVPDAALLLHHLMIVATFSGGAIAAKEKRHLGMSFQLDERGGLLGNLAAGIRALVTGTVTGAFVFASLAFIGVGLDLKTVIWFVPIILFVVAFPIGMLSIIARSFPAKRGPVSVISYIVGLLLSVVVSIPSIAILAGAIDPASSAFFDPISNAYYAGIAPLTIPIIILLILSAFAGTPLFVVLGGLPVFLFAGEGSSAVVIMNEGYGRLTDVNMPAIALFTLAGYILSESKAGPRFVRLFQALFGRLPGGIVIVTVLVCTFFTTFTGATGVTILALGTVLYKILTKSGKYGDKFAIGLLTGSDALGIILPPSLAIILYASIAGADASTSILELFKAGVMPGLLMVIGTIVVGIVLQRKLPKTELPPMSAREILSTLKESFLELLLPVIVIVAFFTGLANIIEASAFAVVYIFVIEVFVKREISAKAFLRLAVKSLVIIGGIMMIVAFARGLSYYFVDAGIPQALNEWAKNNISSQILFLLLLNLVFFISGAFMDIFSAIIVLVPLVVPLAPVFGINQYHLAMIFLTNHIVGFITPPMGFSLFLSAYRFERPLGFIYKSMVPYFIVQVAVVFIVTYVPWFTTALVSTTPSALP